MEENVPESGIVLLFCSPNTRDSPAVQKEVNLALDSENEKIIPVFMSLPLVPKEIKFWRGVRYTPTNIEGLVKKIISIIIEKMRGWAK